MTTEIKQKKQDLGIFYTDQRIADFIFGILKIWKNKEEQKSGRWESRKHFPSVIDPAVGEGVFLKTAVERGFTKTDWIFGLDIDGDVVKKWKDINLLKEFGGKKDDLEAHFFHQNGLDRIHWEQHTKKYRYKIKQKDIEDQQFNLVVGNPPYGGLGIYEEMKMLSESVLSARKVQKVYTQKLDTLFGEQEERVSKVTTTEHVKLPLSQIKTFELKELSKGLINLEIWKDKKYLPQRINHNLNINGVEINLKDILTLKEIEKLKAFPIEILFLERFIQLAKPGGWIAIIIPDGILTNSNSHYVREFVSEKARVEAIVSLPRDAFKNVGTSAKTSILFLQKYKDQEKMQDKNYPVFLAAVDSLDEKNFNLVKENYENYYNKTMSKKNLVQTTTDEKGREIVMVRVDKTLKEMMEACESPNLKWSRFDVKYWHEKYEKIIKIMSANNKLNNFGNFISFFKQGDIPRAARGEKGKGIKVNENNRLLEGTSMNDTGFDFEQYQAVSDKFWQRMKEARIHKNDFIFTRTGASLGQSVVITEEPERIYLVNGALDIIRFNKKLNPFFAVVFIMAYFGQMQIKRIENGVGQPNLNEDELYQILIPDLTTLVQKNIESEYKKMSKYHDKAMEAKQKNNEAEYKKNIETAEKMLKDLIAKTEAVIRGERKDIL